MSLIRAEIRDRRGSNSIYDGVVEYASDFESERMLQSMHPGSLVLCLNLSSAGDSGSTDSDASELYVKREDGRWDKVTTVTKGSEGAPGKSAYRIAVDNGFEETEQEWLDLLKGDTAEPYYVEFTKSGNVYNCNQYYQDVYAQYQAGKKIIFTYGIYEQEAAHFPASGGGNAYFQADMVWKLSGDLIYCQFFLVDILGGNGYETVINTTPASIVNATGQMTEDQAQQTRENIGADNVFVVHFSVQGNTYSCDTSVSDILQAIADEKVVIGILWDQEVFPVISYSSFEVRFGKLVMNDVPSGQTQKIGTYKLVGFTQDEVDTWTLTPIELTVQPRVVVDSQSTTITLTPYDNQMYFYGTLTSLTITNQPQTVAANWTVRFTSGSTATTTTFPSNILGLEDFAAEANTIYEINVLGNLAVVGKWAVST